MTLLFYFRSPAGNTDTGQRPGDEIVYAELLVDKRGEEIERQIAKRPYDILNGVMERRRREEELLFLLTFDGDGYEH